MTRPRTVRVTPQLLREISELGKIAQAFALQLRRIEEAST